MRFLARLIMLLLKLQLTTKTGLSSSSVTVTVTLSKFSLVITISINGYSSGGTPLTVGKVTVSDGCESSAAGDQESNPSSLGRMFSESCGFDDGSMFRCMLELIITSTFVSSHTAAPRTNNSYQHNPLCARIVLKHCLFTIDYQSAYRVARLTAPVVR